MIDLDGISRWHGERVLFRGLNHHFRAGCTTAVCGPSGSGKSSLLRLLNQLERQDEGVLRCGEIAVPAGLPRREWQRRAHALRRRVGMVFQSCQLFPHLSVLANVALAPRRVLGLSPAAAVAAASRWLDQVGMATAAARYPARLSGGEAQRVAIARALAAAPEVLLLDEPTSALDPVATRAVVEILGELRSRGLTLILVTHDQALAAAIADELLSL